MFNLNCSLFFFFLFVLLLLLLFFVAWLQLSSPHGNETQLVDVRWWPACGYALACGCVPLVFTFGEVASRKGTDKKNDDTGGSGGGGGISFSVMLDQDEEAK